METLGILGTGHLASYSVAGLRNAGDEREIIVSPRNADTAANLAANYGCQVAQSNQDVIDRCEFVLLAVRPQQAAGMLDGLAFRPGQKVISAMAGITIDQLQAQPSLEECELYRTLPSVSSEISRGPVPLYPAGKRVEFLLAGLGEVIVFDQESMFDTASLLGCMHGWIYYWLDELVQWTIARGMAPGQAEAMVKHHVLGATELSEHKQESLLSIANSIATEGTYTLTGYEVLKDRHSLTDWTDALEMVSGKLAGSGSNQT